jgi:hypothetical protein
MGTFLKSLLAHVCVFVIKVTGDIEPFPYGTRTHTAKTKCRKFETNIPEKEYRGLSPNFHIHVSVSE